MCSAAVCALVLCLPVADGRAETLTFTRIAQTAEPMPGVNQSFLDLFAPALSGDSVVFVGKGSSGNSGLYRSAAGVVLTREVDSLTLTPAGTPGPAFLSFSDPVLAGNALAFRALTASGTGSTTASVFLVTGTGVSLVAAGSDPSPTGGVYSNAGSPALGAGNVLFSASQGIYLAPVSGAGSVQILADVNTAVPGGVPPFFGDFGFGRVAASGSSSVFSASKGVGSAAPQSGLFFAESGALAAIATSATPIPGGGGAMFAPSSFSRLDVFDHDIAFIGNASAPSTTTGVYLARGGSLQTVADTSTPVPGGSGSFRTFSEVAIDTGMIAFLGTDQAGQQGLYASVGGRSLEKVVAVGDSLDGRQVRSVGFSPNGLDAGALAFVAGLNDGRKGVFLAQPADTMPWAPPLYTMVKNGLFQSGLSSWSTSGGGTLNLVPLRNGVAAEFATTPGAAPTLLTQRVDTPSATFVLHVDARDLAASGSQVEVRLGGVPVGSFVPLPGFGPQRVRIGDPALMGLRDAELQLSVVPGPAEGRVQLGNIGDERFVVPASLATTEVALDTESWSGERSNASPGSFPGAFSEFEVVTSSRSMRGKARAIAMDGGIASLGAEASISTTAADIYAIANSESSARSRFQVLRTSGSGPIDVDLTWHLTGALMTALDGQSTMSFALYLTSERAGTQVPVVKAGTVLDDGSVITADTPLDYGGIVMYSDGTLERHGLFRSEIFGDLQGQVVAVGPQTSSLAIELTLPIEDALYVQDEDLVGILFSLTAKAASGAPNGPAQASVSFLDTLQIALTSDTPGVSFALLSDPIPEPSTWASLAAGLVLLLGRWYRRIARLGSLDAQSSSSTPTRVFPIRSCFSRAGARSTRAATPWTVRSSR